MISLAKEILGDFNLLGKIIMTPIIYIALIFVFFIMLIGGVVIETIINLTIFMINVILIKPEPYLKYNWVKKLI